MTESVAAHGESRAEAPVTARFVVPEGYPETMAHAMVTYSLAPRNGWAFYVIGLMGIVFTVWGSLADPIGAERLVLYAGIVFLAVSALVPLFVVRAVRRTARATWLVGDVLESEFAVDAFTTRDRSVTVTVTYDTYTAIEQWKDAVLLTARPGRSPGPIFYPASLFPEEIRDRFRA